MNNARCSCGKWEGVWPDGARDMSLWCCGCGGNDETHAPKSMPMSFSVGKEYKP